MPSSLMNPLNPFCCWDTQTLYLPQSILPAEYIIFQLVIGRNLNVSCALFSNNILRSFLIRNNTTPTSTEVTHYFGMANLLTSIFPTCTFSFQSLSISAISQLAAKYLAYVEVRQIVNCGRDQENIGLTFRSTNRCDQK